VTHPAQYALEAFLASVERRAFKQVVFAVRDEEAALDIIQDAMIRLAESYGDRPADEWPRLFTRIVKNATLDWFRRQKTRNNLFSNLSDFESDDEESFDLLEAVSVTDALSAPTGPAESLEQTQKMAEIEAAIENLPARQREAFLLRYWEDMDVAETAQVMGCSEGSVKTHCSRAVHALAIVLREKGISL
jgi:RNA polymerase sigma-70 factor, ECF subfamily